jgi:hypothetical protein
LDDSCSFHVPRITLNSPQRITIADALLTKSHAVFLTKTGQIFLGPVSEKPSGSSAGASGTGAGSKKDNVDTFALRSSYVPVGRLGAAMTAGKAFHLPREAVRVDRVPGIWRGVRVAADPKVTKHFFIFLLFFFAETLFRNNC